MIVNISPDPSAFDETLHVLRFSAIASQVSSQGQGRGGEGRREGETKWGEKAQELKQENHNCKVLILWDGYCFELAIPEM